MDRVVELAVRAGPSVSGSGPKRALGGAAAVALLGSLFLPSAALVASDAADGGAGSSSIVVTTEVLGAITRDLVGDHAGVSVLMDGAADPHAWQPSARDIERVFSADLVVANGLDLEEGLLGVLDQARLGGVEVFEAAGHLAVASPGEDPAGPTHEHAASDPHFWLDPLAVREVAGALAPALEAVGVPLDDRAAALDARLVDLDAEVREILAVVPPDRRRLVTGHDSLRWFADRYGFEILGAIIPGRSTQAEVSARELSALIAAIRDAAVPAVFTEVGTPRSVGDAVAAEAGARLIELRVTQLPEDGSYVSLIRELASDIAAALAA